MKHLQQISGTFEILNTCLQHTLLVQYGWTARQTGVVEAALQDGRSRRGARWPGRIRAGRSKQWRGRAGRRERGQGARSSLSGWTDACFVALPLKTMHDENFGIVLTMTNHAK
jgi:hypothetical protein